MSNDKNEQNVLLVRNCYQIPSGEDTVVANEKKLLEDNGHEVFLYSRNNSELKTMSKIQKLLLPLTTVFSLKTYREVKHIIEEQNVEIVHVHNKLNLSVHLFTMQYSRMFVLMMLSRREWQHEYA